jgi:Glyoxalase/Bleomycin resistance protein/Dioxygenase superfamily
MQPIDVLAFSHLGLVVTSIDEFRASWGALLGIEDWHLVEVSQDPGRVQLHGELIEQPSRSRVAMAKFRGTALELIEPIDGLSGGADWLRKKGAGLQHIAVWVRDLPAVLADIGGGAQVTYSPAVLHPMLASRPVAASVTSGEAQVRPPFWAYVQPLTATASWTLELLDARFAATYREYYGDTAYYPGDLPDTDTLAGRIG